MLCETCANKGFVRTGDEVLPCPRCNPDSGFAPGEYEGQLIEKHGRCNYAIGGGGRTCPLHKGHKQNHVFECGR